MLVIDQSVQPPVEDVVIFFFIFSGNPSHPSWFPKRFIRDLFKGFFPEILQEFFQEFPQEMFLDVLQWFIWFIFQNLSRSFSKDSEITSGISTLGYVDTIRNYSSKNSSSSILGYFSSDSFFPRFSKNLFLNSWKMPSQYVISIFAGFFLEVFSVRYSFRNFPKILAGMSLIILAQIPSRSFLLI